MACISTPRDVDERGGRALSSRTLRKFTPRVAEAQPSGVEPTSRSGSELATFFGAPTLSRKPKV
ncbi:hypothetical protein Mapa_014432 [Marchantia paleacea]|nr:hypothetical protein Mapa_014432 [Marchantia paleacea]